MKLSRIGTVIAAVAIASSSATAIAHGGMEHVMGTVKAIDDKSLTVETKDRKTVTLGVTGDTEFQKDGKPAQAADVKVGDRVVIHAMDKPGTEDKVAHIVKIGSAKTGEEKAHPDDAKPARDDAKPSTPTGKQGSAEKPSTTQTVAISVTDDGFTPANVKVKKGQPVSLVVTRMTDETCAKAIKLPDLGVQKDLPLNQPVTIAFTPTKSGDIKYSCAMDMMGGVITVE